MIDEHGKSKPVWAVINSKVFSVYDQYNHLSVLKLYRISQLQIKDYLHNSCFQLKRKENIHNNKMLNTKTNDYFEYEKLKKSVDDNNNNKQLNKINHLLINKNNELYCLSNENEKNIWLNSIQYYIDNKNNY